MTPATSDVGRAWDSCSAKAQGQTLDQVLKGVIARHLSRRGEDTEGARTRSRQKKTRSLLKGPGHYLSSHLPIKKEKHQHGIT